MFMLIWENFMTFCKINSIKRFCSCNSCPRFHVHKINQWFTKFKYNTNNNFYDKNVKCHIFVTMPINFHHRILLIVICFQINDFAKQDGKWNKIFFFCSEKSQDKISFHKLFLLSISFPPVDSQFFHIPLLHFFSLFLPPPLHLTHSPRKNKK